MQPKLSVIIPCYNLGAFLNEAITSVKEYKGAEEVEIIVVNDGSDDPLTLEILKEQEEKGIFVFHQKNTGPGGARNSGIRLAKGKYILPLDADNKIRPKFLGHSLCAFEKEEEIDIIYGDAWYFGEKMGMWKVGKFDFPSLLYSNYIDTCAFFKKSVWEEIGGYDEKRILMGSEDWDFWLRAYLKGFKFKYIEEISFDYRVRKNSLVNVARERGSEIVDYIFSKPEFKNLVEVRIRLGELQQAINQKKSEPSLLELVDILIKKINKKARG